MKNKLSRFLSGRYGADQFGMALVMTSLLVLVLNIWVQQSFLTFLAYALWIYALYRMFSRQYSKRRQENYRYLRAIGPLKRQKNLWKNRFKDRNHRYFLCPSCHQMVRVPKGHGKVDVTCPKCRHVFERRS